MSDQVRALPVYPVADVIPHTGLMCLIDRICACDTDKITTEVMVTTASTFATPEGVPAWIGLEYMAQSIAALAGSRARWEGQPVQIGFLVGTRSLAAYVPLFKMGSRLRIYARELVQGSNGLGVYACRITLADKPEQLLLCGDVNVFIPENSEEYLRGEP